MTATAATETRDAASLALALFDALRLGLPAPDYMGVWPGFAGSAVTSAISFQFNARDKLDALAAWADRFGVSVRVAPGRRAGASAFHQISFTHCGVLFDAYVEVKADEA